MTRRITLAIAAVTSDDGTRCAPECPHHRHDTCAVYGGRLLARGGPGTMRSPGCLAAEQEAREAEVAAFTDGFDLAETYCGWATTHEVQEHLAGAIARIRGGKS